ncbi:hypothetical protein [Acetobacter senegalensis]|uniref:hypothetical protein n=1 Tax=Acetobacter senegalensis TaxID=446692 RepID=UPI001EE0F091|nr:hypothetical protein [Acetobacter senegalensis]MCG4274466.1 hypothetical protein [Acetobacter senegalensis]
MENSSHTHFVTELQDADALSLARVPSGDCAQEFVADVSERIRPLVVRKPASEGGPPSGRERDKGRDKRTRETGIILAGLMRKGFKGKWCQVNEGHSGWFWSASRKLPFGNKAFWTKTRAMIELGLLDYVSGKGWKDVWGEWQGEKARLRPSQALLRLAESYGCTKETAFSDWPLRAPAPVSDIAEPVQIEPFPDSRNTGTEPVPQDLLLFMQRLQDAIARHRFSGCARPVLQMKFIGSLSFHGRIYAKGADNYQSMAREDRQFIKIDGEPVQEVDISAASLSIALLLSGHALPPGDLYTLPGIDAAEHRKAVKQWFVATFGAGKPCCRWSARVDAKIRSTIRATTIKQAALMHYTFLRKLDHIVPDSIMQTVPQSYREKAVGQYLISVEAQIMRRAMDDIAAQGGVALPLHDALLVPVSWADKAQKAIEQASHRLLGHTLRVKVPK